MKYTPPTGGAANDPYVGRNLASGIQGSRVPPNAVEHDQREIVAVIQAAGLTPSDTDLTQLLQAIRKLFPQKQTSDVTLYVRTDGNDTTGDGSANTAAKAFATIAKAIDYGGKTFFLPNGVGLVIQLGNAGTYVAPGDIVGPAQVSIIGNAASPTSYIIAGAGSASNYALVMAIGSDVSLNGLTIQNNGTSSFNVGASNGHILGLQNIRFQTSTINVPGLISSSNASVNVGAGCVAAGSAQTVFNAQLNGIIGILENFVVSGTQSYPQSFTFANFGGIVTLRLPSITVTGTVTSTPRYNLSMNGMINTGGNGINYFPGTSAGVTSTGGQYA